MRNVNFCFSFVLTLFAIALSGCGGGGDAPPLGRVSGTVTFQGEPVDGAEITFMSDDGVVAAATLGSDGTYQVSSEYGRGIPLGTYHVAVTPPAPSPEDVDDDGNPLVDQSQFDKIPDMYRDFAQSGLEITVTEGSNTFDVDMQQP